MKIRLLALALGTTLASGCSSKQAEGYTTAQATYGVSKTGL